MKPWKGVERWNNSVTDYIQMLTFVSRASLLFFRTTMPFVASMLQSPTNSVSLSNFKCLCWHSLAYASWSFPKLTSFLAFPLTIKISAHVTSFCCKGMPFCAAQLLVELYTSDMTLAMWLRVTRRGFEGGSAFFSLGSSLWQRSWLSTSSTALLCMQLCVKEVSLHWQFMTTRAQRMVARGRVCN